MEQGNADKMCVSFGIGIVCKPREREERGEWKQCLHN